MSNIIGHFFSSYMVAYIFMYSTKVIYNKHNLKNELGFILSFGTATFIATNISLTLKFFSLPILSILLVKFFFKFSARDAFMTSIMTFMGVILADILTGFIFTALFKLPAEVVKNDTFLSLVANFTLCAFIFLMVNFIKKCKLVFTDNANLDKKKTFLSYVYIGITFLIISANSIVYTHVIEYKNKIFLIIGIITSILFFVLNLVFIKTHNEYANQKIALEKQELEYKQLQAYTSIIEELVNRIRVYKHDYKNVLLSVEGFLTDKDLEGLEEYFYKELSQQHEQTFENEAILSLQRIKNSGIKGLLTAKFYATANKNIEFLVSILEDINEINFKTIDICRVLGVLIDNAIEASEVSANKKIILSFSQDETETIITISNSFKELIPIHKMFEEGVSSKGTERGIGLYNIQKLLDTNYPKTILNTFVSNDLFTQQLLIPTKKAD